MTTSIAVDNLTQLGFTETEALVYCELLSGGAASGYKLAKAIGKAQANVYQALGSLAQKGAVLVEEGQVQTVRATDPGELLTALEAAFGERRRKAGAALEQLSKVAADDRIYELKSAGQVLSRAAAMIDAATDILVFDLSGELLARLKTQLDAAAGRGVEIAGLTYGPTPAAAYPVVVSPASGFAIRRWPGLQLTIVADAREHLVGLFSADMSQVRHGIWSDSVYLACLQHSGLTAEIRLASRQTGGGDLDHISLLTAYPPGLGELIGPPQSDDRPLIAKEIA